MEKKNRISITSSSFRRKLNEHKSKQDSFYKLPFDSQNTNVSPPLPLTSLSNTRFSDVSSTSQQQQQQQTTIGVDSSRLPLSSTLPCTFSSPSVLPGEDNNFSLPYELTQKCDLAQLKMFVLQTMPLRDFLTNEWQKIYYEYQKLCKPYWMNQKPRVRNPLVELRASLRSFDEVIHMDVSSSTSSSLSSSALTSSSSSTSLSKKIPTYESPFTPDNQEQNFKNQMTGNNSIMLLCHLLMNLFFCFLGWEFCLCNPKIASFIIIHKCVFWLVCHFFLLEMIRVIFFEYLVQKSAVLTYPLPMKCLNGRKTKMYYLLYNLGWIKFGCKSSTA